MTVTAATATTAATSGPSALSSLSGNFNDFLKLLMTQLQNQDPSAPMDTNQFTQQLVQFSSVEQQINTNTSLTKLIDATQGAALLQSTALTGKEVQVSGDQLSLQGGKAGLQMSTKSPGQATVTISSPAGIPLRQQTVTLAPGANDWTWDGRSNSGAALPDGAYKVSVQNLDGSSQAFTVRGTATGVQRTGGAMKVNMGKLQVDFSDVQSVGS